MSKRLPVEEPPYEDIGKILDYLWRDEERHYEERTLEDIAGARVPHIFTHLQAVAAWLERTGH